MARLRLTLGGAIPVDPVRPPLVMGGSFVVSGTASKVDGLGQAAVAIGGSLTAYPAQALSGAFVVSAGAKLKVSMSGAFAVSGTASTVTAVGEYALSPAYGTKWVKHQDAVSDASITQLGAGLGARLTGGTAVADDTNGIALWAKRRTAGDWDATFTTKKLDATAPNSPSNNPLTEEFLLFCFGMTGNGGVTYPADVSTWAATTKPQSHTYRDHCTGARLTLYSQTDADGAVGHAVRLGVFVGDGSVTNVEGTTLFPNVQNTTYTWTIKRRGNTITASATDGVSTWQDTWTSTLIASKADAGNVGLVATPRRQVEVGDITLTDGISTGTTWPNGYLYRRRIVLAAQPDLTAETLANFPAFLDSTRVPGDWTFLATANGKLLSVSGSTPRDIRFELEDGVTKLDHYVEKFDGTAGTLRCFVRIPAGAQGTPGAVGAGDWSTDQSLRFYMYYGKSGLAASEENIAGTWQGASLVIAPTAAAGTDLTGKGHALASTGTLTDTTLDGRPAVQAADQTGGHLRRTNSDLTFLDNIGGTVNGELTEEFWAKISTASSGDVTRLGGDLTDGSQTFQRARFSNWAEAVGKSGGKANVLQAGTQWWGSDSKYHDESTESNAGIADGTTVRHYMIVRKSNQNTQLYDGETNISSRDYAGTPSAGTIHPQSYDNFSLGAGTGLQNTTPAMTMGLYIVWPFAFSATRRALADRLQRDGSLVASLGGVDLVGDTNHSPAGVTFRQAITAQTNLDFQAHAYDPDAGATITATAVTPASDSSATYAIVSGQLRVTPVAGVTGTGRPVVTISDGAKTSKVSPVLAISSGSGGGGAYPDNPHTSGGGTLRTVGYTAGGSPSYTTIAAAVAAAAAGDEVSVDTGSFAGGTLSSSGTATAPIIVRWRGDPRTTALGALITSNLTISGNNIYLYGFNFGQNTITLSGDGIALARWKVNNTGHVKVSGSNCLVGYCELDSLQQTIGVEFATGSRSGKLTALWAHGAFCAGNGGECFRFGTGSGTRAEVMGHIAERCLLENIRYVKDASGGSANNEAVSIKSQGNRLRQVTVSQPAGITADGDALINIRHGQDNVLDGCFATGPKSGIGVRGKNNIVLGPKTVGGAGLQLDCGDQTFAQWIASGTGRPRAEGTIVALADCSVFTIGAATPTTLNAFQTRIEANVRRPQTYTGLGDKPGTNGAVEVATTTRTARTATLWNSTTDTGVRATWTGWPT